MLSRPSGLRVLLPLLAPIVLLAGGCAKEKSPVQTAPPPDILTLRQIPEELKADLGPVVDGNTAFALSLYARLKDRPGNLFLSPYSISTALAMTWAGARGQTEEEMVQTLHFTLPQDRLHPIFGALQKSLEAGAGQGGYRLDIANRLWGQEGFHWLPAFLELNQRCYGAGLENLDFQSDPEACRRVINAWVEEQTENKIRDLLPPGSLDALTRLVLTNAIYFKGKWQVQFDPRQTRNDRFTLPSGQQVQVPFMSMPGGHFAVDPSSDPSVLVLPYSGLDLAMVFLVPRQAGGLAGLEARLTPQNLAAWVEAAQPRDIEVYIPRFRTTSEFSLGAVLGEMGMQTAFDPNQADFSGMDGQHDLAISDAVHKAYVDVNEEGTEAAAATRVIVGTTSVGEIFSADHPFLFLIVDQVTSSILFMGRIEDPRWSGYRQRHSRDQDPVCGQSKR